MNAIIRIWIVAAAASCLAFGTAAQTSSGTQAGASASAQAQASGSAPVGQVGAQTSAQTSTSASAVANTRDDAFQLQDGQTIHANLEHSIDAKKCKPGDAVEARTTEDVKENGAVVLKKGSRLHGHVTEAQARSKASSESSLGVVFDRATAKHGQEMPLHLGIQALAAPAVAAAAPINDDGAMAGAMAGGSAHADGGLLGGARGTVGGATSVAGGTAGNLTGAASATGGAATNVAGNANGAVNGTVGAAAHGAGSVVTNSGGLNAAGQLTAGSRGVFGLQGMSLTSSASSATRASVISSSSRNVHLDSGTQMELQAIAQ